MLYCGLDLVNFEGRLSSSFICQLEERVDWGVVKSHFSLNPAVPKLWDCGPPVGPDAIFGGSRNWLSRLGCVHQRWNILTWGGSTAIQSPFHRGLNGCSTETFFLLDPVAKSLGTTAKIHTKPIVFYGKGFFHLRIFKIHTIFQEY